MRGLFFWPVSCLAHHVGSAIALTIIEHVWFSGTARWTSGLIAVAQSSSSITTGHLLQQSKFTFLTG